MKQRETDPSKKQLAYNQIKSRLLNSHYERMEALTERRLCKELGFSRTPVREALRKLSYEGLIQLEDGKGASCKRIERKDMTEVFELREALERMAVRLFMQRKTDADLQKLSECMMKQEEAFARDNHQEFIEADMQFHHVLWQAGRNDCLNLMINSIYDQVALMAVSAKDDILLREEALREHQRLMAAVLADDSQEAQAAITAHVIEIKRYHLEKYSI